MTQTLPSGFSVTVKVPASTANLGPGFDTLGLALGLYDEVTVTTAESGLQVNIEGEGAQDVPRGPSNLVVRAIERGLEYSGVWADGLIVNCRNTIPHSRGLGSSASATVAGLVAANTLAAMFNPAYRMTQTELVQIASEFEGHPDNTSASILGGAVVSWKETNTRENSLVQADVSYHAVGYTINPSIRAFVLVPEERSLTVHARQVLPELVPHRSAAFNVSRVALLIIALTCRPDVLMAATEDMLHQTHRAAALPLTTKWITTLRQAGFAAAISGAGPSVLVLTTEQFPDALRQRAEAEGIQVSELDIAAGVEVISSSKSE